MAKSMLGPIGTQDPGGESTFKGFCRLTCRIRFPMYANTKIRDEDAEPFFAFLVRAAGEPRRWNFHKHLANRNGRLAGSFNSSTEPGNNRLIGAMEKLL